MRIARVIGKLTLNRCMPDVKPGSYLLVRTLDRKGLAGTSEGNDETVVLYDNLGAREGDLVGLVEGREATVPFRPDRVPYDSYNACIIDKLYFNPILET